MKFHYPKFLKANPKFIGLSFFDLVLMLLALMISSFFHWGSMSALGLILVLVGMSKLATLKYPRGHFQFFLLKRNVLHWREELLKLTQGILL